jgi:hypothetical protein
MWDSDKQWVPQVLAGQMLSGTFVFDEAGKKVESFEVGPLVK